MAMKDQAGVEVKVGDVIIYAVVRNFKAHLNKLTVTSVDAPKLKGRNAKGNIVVLRTASFLVIGDSWTDYIFKASRRL